jgi:transposase
VRITTVLRALLGLQHTRITGFRFTESELVVAVAPSKRSSFCSGCGKRGPRYDRRERRWRHLDTCGMAVELEYAVWRVDCPRCGVRVEMVPWADGDTGFTLPFEDTVAYLAQRTDKTTVTRLMRVAWETVGRIIERVVARLGPAERLDGLRSIGIDELSYRRHHEYLTIVSNQDTGEVVWAAPGKDATTVRRFFEELGPERTALLETVTMDMSGVIKTVVAEQAPHARIVYDRFHVQRLAHDALDAVRRQQWRAADPEDKRAIKGTRFALQKNPWNLSVIEYARLACVQRTNKALYRAYLLKETLCEVLDRRQVHVARDKLGEWLAWASRSRLPPFRKLARTIKAHAEGILAYVATGLSNGRAEGLNGKVRTITRRSFGFHSAYSLIALIFLCCSGLAITLPHHVPDLAIRAPTKA